MRGTLKAAGLAVLVGWLALVGLGALSPAHAADGGPDAAESPAQVQGPGAPAQEATGEPPAQIRLSALGEEESQTTLGDRLLSLLGLLTMLLLGWLLSKHKRLFPWRIVLWGIGLQLVFGLFIMKTEVGKGIFVVLNDMVRRLLDFTEAGSRFVFGPLMNEWSFALNVLPTIVFFSSLMTVLYYLGLMQGLVKGAAWVMQRTMGTSGAETLSAAANIFVGQTEAPLVVKPFVPTMTESELMAVMTGGFATVAGGVMASYVGMLSGTFPDIAGHLIAASVMSAPAALVLSKIMIPETGTSLTAGTLKLAVERPDANVIDAAARGAGEGLKLALNVGAMLLAFIALVAMINYLVGLPALWHNADLWAAARGLLSSGGQPLPEGCADPQGALALQACVEGARPLLGTGLEGLDAWTPLSLERILGWLFWPVAWVMGVPARDCGPIAQLLGEKLVLNEFYAYAHLAEMLRGGTPLSHRSVVIATYALCGFANFGSMAIQIGGIGGIAPTRRHDLARIGLRAMIGGTLAAFTTATIAGMLIR